MADHFDPYHKWLGIPPKDQPPTHYRLLGIEPLENDPDVIEHAADQRMRHVRSFQVGQRQALSQQLLGEIASAKLCLLDPVQKAEYDRRFTREVPLVPPAKPLPAAAAGPEARQPLRPIPVKPLAAQADPLNLRIAPQRPPDSIGQLAKVVAGCAAVLVLALLIAVFVRAARQLPDSAGATRSQDASQIADAQEPEPPGNTPAIPPTPVSPSSKPADIVNSPAPKLPPLVGDVTVEKFTWERGKEPIDLGPSQDSFVVLSWVAGFFLGNGEWFRVNVDDAGRYRLEGGGVQPVGVSFSCVRSPYRKWFEDKVETATWRKGQGKIKLIHQHDGFAVLSGAAGCFLGPEHAVSLQVDPADGFWYLDGQTNFDTQGHALIYRFKESGQFQPELQQVDWSPNDPSKTMFPTLEGLCGVTGLSGAFKGYGENLNSSAEHDGHWHIWGHTLAHTTRGSFSCVRFSSPKMLALSPGAPQVRLSTQND